MSREKTARGSLSPEVRERANRLVLEHPFFGSRRMAALRDINQLST